MFEQIPLWGIRLNILVHPAIEQKPIRDMKQQRWSVGSCRQKAMTDVACA